jgi:hypothetical protein
MTLTGCAPSSPPWTRSPPSGVPKGFPFGSTGLYRLRVDRYRVLYTVTDDLMSVGHIARTARDA